MKASWIIIALTAGIVLHSAAPVSAAPGPGRSRGAWSLRLNMAYMNGFTNTYSSPWDSYLSISAPNSLQPSVDVTYRSHPVQFSAGAGYAVTLLRADMSQNQVYEQQTIVNRDVAETFRHAFIHAGMDVLFASERSGFRPGVTISGDVFFATGAQGEANLMDGTVQRYDVDTSPIVYAVSGGLLLQIAAARRARTLVDVRLQYRVHLSNMYVSVETEFRPDGIVGMISYYIF
ncbi:MAG: hypothetical protein WBQ23_04300 [Bacteroidota bacterium]